MNVMRFLFSDRGKDLGLLLLRIGFGVGMIYHGWGKVMAGAEGTIGFATSVGFPLPVFFGWVAALSEFVGGIGLLLGLFTRPSAFFIVCTMYTAAFVRHAADPFSVKELALTYLFAGLCLLVTGPGKWSMDRLLQSADESSLDDRQWGLFSNLVAVLTVIFLSAGFYYSSLQQDVTSADQQPAIQTESVTYRHDGVSLEGYLAYPTSSGEEPRPGVMVVHQWMGLGDYEKKRARQLAEMGYVAFAADVYGSDTRPETTHEASLASSTFREDRNLYRRRLSKSLDVLRDRERVNGDQLAAIGYCFGGTGVLELARDGADLDAVVSFHGGLTNPTPEDASNIKATVQVHHGAQDANVTQKHVQSFWNEMNQHATVDWDLRVYSNAEHGFTESHSDAYNERADRLSWSAMKRLFDREFSGDE